MGACVQAGNHQQMELNTMDQIRLYENRQVILDYAQHIQEENQQQANLQLQAELEQIARENQVAQENQRIQQQMIDLYDPSREESSRQIPDIELQSLKVQAQPIEEILKCSPLIFETEKNQKNKRPSSLVLLPTINKNNASKSMQLIDLLHSKEQAVLAQPLPSPPNQNNYGAPVYDAFDSADITPATMKQQIDDDEVEELDEEEEEEEEEIEQQKQEQVDQEEIKSEVQEIKLEIQEKLEEVQQEQIQIKLDNPIFQEHQEKTISIEESQIEQSVVHEPKEREIKLLSSKGDQMVISFAPSQQQVFVKDNQVEIPSMNHKPSLEKAIPYDSDVVKIRNEYIVLLLSQLEPLSQNMDLSDCEMLGPYMILDTGDIYVGTWQKGKRHGFGKQIFQNGAYYEGQWLNDFLQGFGRYFFQNGDYYTGEFVHGERQGQGELVYTDGFTYAGGWDKNCKNGQGEEKLNNTVYTGEFKNGRRDGKGKLQNEEDGSVFEGLFKEGKMCGFGTQTWPDGKRYEGEWKDGKMHGQGEFIWEEGKMYKGEYVNGTRHGYGEYSWPDGRTYKGGWKNGVMHGKGLMIWPDQRLQKGIWNNGKKQFTKEELAKLQKVNKTQDQSASKTKDLENKKEKKGKKKSKSKSKEKKRSESKSKK